ncbi:hypothetical protein ABZ791_26755 [Streptomyces huasconensis]|uniref:Uncharacterized protein n=1 Tax=Streptomyces huasconensis TaxID=1854574 RepID=A0ABV3LWI4_9ACTN
MPLPAAPPDPYDCPFHELLVTEPERGRLDALLVPQLLRSALTDSRADGFVVRLPAAERGFRRLCERFPAVA